MATDTRETITDKRTILRYIAPATSMYVFFLWKGAYKGTKSGILSSDEQTFTIPEPFPEEPLIRVAPKTELLFRMYLSDGAFEFHSPCIERLATQLPHLIRMAIPKTLVRIQRREAFRVSTSLPATFSTLSTSALGKMQDENVLILDLSLKGVLMAANPAWQSGREGTLSFSHPLLPELFRFPSKILRIKKIQNPKSGFAFHYGVSFPPLLAMDENRLARFINEIQLRSRAE